MGIFGAAKKGFGMLGKARAKNRMLRGTSTRADRIKHGGRSADIKSVPMSKEAKKGNIKESVRLGKQHFYLKNIDEVNKHNKTIREGEKAIKDAKKKMLSGTSTRADRIKHGGRIGKQTGGRTDLFEELGRVEAEPSNRNRRAEVSRIHGELNKGYSLGGRVGAAKRGFNKKILRKD